MLVSNYLMKKTDRKIKKKNKEINLSFRFNPGTMKYEPVFPKKLKGKLTVKQTKQEVECKGT